MSPIAQEYLQGIHDRHQRNILNYLAGEQLHFNDLWLSVGYFFHGSGKYEDRSFANKDQWLRLLKETGR